MKRIAYSPRVVVYSDGVQVGSDFIAGSAIEKLYDEYKSFKPATTKVLQP